MVTINSATVYVTNHSIKKIIQKEKIFHNIKVPSSNRNYTSIENVSCSEDNDIK